MIGLDKLKNLMEWGFGEPYLDRGVVKVWWSRSGEDSEGAYLSIRIHGRGICINESGEVIEAVTEAVTEEWPRDTARDFN